MPEKIVVVGAGVMGSGIAQVLVTGGYEVALVDVADEVLEGARTGIRARLARLKEKGVIDEESFSGAMGRLKISVDLLGEVRDALFVIEAVPEKLELKQDLFSSISREAPRDAVLASNTSELSVTAIAGATVCPDRVIGMHWFNPPPLMKLIEVVVGVDTSTETVDKTVALSKAAGKEVVIVQDRQGFVTTRVLCAFLIECYRVLEEGIATRDDIDKAVRLAFNHPMGPFELSDMIGLDTILFASKGLAGAFGERFRAPQSLVKLVEAQRCGVKSGEGFYRYEK
ncbi:MAG: 3-hydroxybutyryl-CoA dehydrogenase [Deltaproteobacteria bacterium]|nr:3-hydroxybutyryl-CoA dehydrogenase [Deltaproteobacteria bacterium]NIS77964.1 3-hydroxybutyryl-CoA dehydrogenase [Deltaproteobacteria bacterium]